MIRFVLLFVLLLASCSKEVTKHKLSGEVFGTTYNIQYFNKPEVNFQKEIDSIFKVINVSMSNYIPNSDISKINRGETISVDVHFENVFSTSKEIYKLTNGVFDPTIGNLVNYWNFGAKRNENAIDSLTIDSLKQFVGFNKLTINNSKVKLPDNFYIDFNAVAKGYAVDVVSEFLTKNNSTNHLVEIGGEIRTSGYKNLDKAFWRVGIQEPNFNGESGYSTSLPLKNEAMATSGTYRKFKVDKNGSKYAHIINTKTGYPVKTNILSVSVIANSCMIADAYATAFQAMTLDEIKKFSKSHLELKVFLIYENDFLELESLSINDFLD